MKLMSMIQQLKFLIISSALLGFTQFIIKAQPTEEIIKLLASDGSAVDYFGYSVGISGDYAIVGSQLGDENIAGCVYIYHNNSGNWQELCKLTASDGGPGDYFGNSVSISGDYAIVGAYGADVNGDWSGFAYIFHNNEGDWQQQTKLAASDASDWDSFGGSVSISGDYAIIGAVGKENNGINSGSAYIFHNNGEDWQEIEILSSPNPVAGDFFGQSVSIFGNYAAIGAQKDINNGIISGSVYIFHYNEGSWQNVEKLTASDGNNGDRFGYSLSISENYILIGSKNNDSNGYASGSCYVFYKDDDNWQEQSKLTPTDINSNYNFGTSVSISEDYAIIGAYGSNITTGAAYIFHKNGESWEQFIKFIPTDSANQDWFGCSTSISGSNVIVGAMWNDDNGFDSGSAYIFGSPVPIITSQPIDENNGCHLETVSFSIIAQDADSYQWQVSTNSGASYINLENNTTYSGVHSSALSVVVSFALNNNLYRCVVINSYGSINSNPAVFNFDSEAPPPPLLTNVSGECSIIISAPTTTDNCAGIITGITSAPVNYNEIGIYSIPWTFDDGNGNISYVNQTVIVEDNTNPFINCVDDAEVKANDSHTYTVRGTEFNPLNIGDNCGIKNCINDYNNNSTLKGTSFPEGETTVTWKVTDKAENVSICSFKIIVDKFNIPIYPNPAKDFITIDFKGTNFKEIALNDILGKSLLLKPITEEKINIDLSGYSEGVYFVRIIGPKKIFTTKVVKK